MDSQNIFVLGGTLEGTGSCLVEATAPANAFDCVLSIADTRCTKRGASNEFFLNAHCSLPVLAT